MTTERGEMAYFITNQSSIAGNDLPTPITDAVVSEDVNESNIPSSMAEYGSEDKQFIFSAEELLSDPMEQIPMLWEPFFPKVGLVAIVGSSDAGKSAFLRDFAMNLVGGKSHYLDFQLHPKHGSVLYVSTEDDKSAITCLIKKQKPEGSDNKAYEKLRFMFETENLIDLINDAIEKEPVDCIIIDSFSDVMEGDLNRSTGVRSFLDKFGRIAFSKELLVIFLHHMSKRSDEANPSKRFVLGSQGFEAKLRMVAELRKDKESDAYRHFCVLKGNYIPSEHKGKSYVLRFTENLTFINMGDRVSLNSLSGSRKAQDYDEIKKRAIELKVEGKSTREIAELLAKEGFKVGKTKIAELLKEAA